MPRAASTRRASAARACFGVKRRRAAPARRRAARPAAPRRGRRGAALPRPGRIPARSRRSPRRPGAGAVGRQRRQSCGRARQVAGDVVAPGRHGDGDAGRVARLHARSRGAPGRAHRLVGAAGRARHSPARRSKRSVALRRQAGSAPADDDLARLAAAELDDHRASRLRAPRAAAPGRCRARSAARASVRMSWRRPDSAMRTGSNSAHSMKHSVVRLVAAGGLAADDAAQRLGAVGVGDDAVLRRSARRSLPFSAASVSPVARHAHGQRRALHLRHVEDVQRAAEVEGEEVGDVDQRVDRAQADRDQPVLQPLRARARSSRRAPRGRAPRCRRAGRRSSSCSGEA